jgi:hypothetical protein
MRPVTTWRISRSTGATRLLHKITVIKDGSDTRSCSAHYKVRPGACQLSTTNLPKPWLQPSTCLAGSSCLLEDGTDVLSRNVVNYSRNVGNYSRNIGNYSRNVVNYSRNVGNYSRNVGNYFRNVVNYSRNVGNYSRTVGNYSRNVVNYSRNVGNYSRNVGN